MFQWHLLDVRTASYIKCVFVHNVERSSKLGSLRWEFTGHSQRASYVDFDVPFVVCRNKLLSKQSSNRWFEMSCHSSLHHWYHDNWHKQPPSDDSLHIQVFITTIDKWRPAPVLLSNSDVAQHFNYQCVSEAHEAAAYITNETIIGLRND